MSAAAGGRHRSELTALFRAIRRSRSASGASVMAVSPRAQRALLIGGGGPRFAQAGGPGGGEQVVGKVAAADGEAREAAEPCT